MAKQELKTVMWFDSGKDLVKLLQLAEAPEAEVDSIVRKAPNVLVVLISALLALACIAYSAQQMMIGNAAMPLATRVR